MLDKKVSMFTDATKVNMEMYCFVCLFYLHYGYLVKYDEVWACTSAKLVMDEKEQK